MALKRKQHKNTGLIDGQLNRCPDMANCVCSMYDEDEQHYAAPWAYEASRQEVMEKLKSLIRSRGSAWIEESRDNYLHACFEIPLMGFIDDVEFYLPEDQKIIHFRSASRIGHSDLGVNKRRMKKLRKQLGRLLSLTS